jgi:hypothetical protein
MALKFTLDSNCLFEVDECRSEAQHVLKLVQAHLDKRASVAVVAISASERQRSGKPLEQFGEFEARLQAMGFGALEMIYPILYFDVTFWDRSVFTDKAGVELEENIQRILFPGIPTAWADYCAAISSDVNAPNAGALIKWRNAKCDVQAMWAHTTAKRDVFVTLDQNFLKSKRASLIALCGGRIETPSSAAALLAD